MLGAMLVQCRGWKQYGKAYRLLPRLEWDRFQTIVTGSLRQSPGFLSDRATTIVINWHLDDNDFTIGEHPHKYYLLSKPLLSWCDPYTHYWMRKYRRWFKENMIVENAKQR